MARALNEEQIQRILQGIRIPPQPQILVDLQMEQVMPEPDISRIARLIQQDVGLSGTILKVVNSPFYGLKNRITSILQAVNLIGIDIVVNIVNGLSIKSQMSDETIVSMNRFSDIKNSQLTGTLRSRNVKVSAFTCPIRSGFYHIKKPGSDGLYARRVRGSPGWL